METSKTTKPNWTEEQCLLLVFTILIGRFNPCVSEHTKRQAWENTMQQINASFLLDVHTSEECKTWWCVLQSEAKGGVQHTNGILHAQWVLSQIFTTAVKVNLNTELYVEYRCILFLEGGPPAKLKCFNYARLLLPLQHHPCWTENWRLRWMSSDSTKESDVYVTEIMRSCVFIIACFLMYAP